MIYIAVDSPGWLVVEALVWLADSDGVERALVANGLAVGPLDWLVDSDKSVLWQDVGKDMPHADQRAGLVALGKVGPLTVALKYFTQHPTLVLKVFRAVWQVWVHPCVKSRLHWDILKA